MVAHHICHLIHKMIPRMASTAGPESLEYYFRKGALLGQKADSIPGQIFKNLSREFEGLAYLAYQI